MCSRVCRLLNAITFAVHLIVVYKLFLLPDLVYCNGGKAAYETLLFAADYCSFYVSAIPKVKLTYINHRNCIHVRTFNLRGGLVGDAVVVSLSKKEQVYVNLIHWKTVQINLQYCLILNHKKLLYVIFSHFPKIPSRQK